MAGSVAAALDRNLSVFNGRILLKIGLAMPMRRALMLAHGRAQAGDLGLEPIMPCLQRQQPIIERLMRLEHMDADMQRCFVGHARS